MRHDVVGKVAPNSLKWDMNVENNGDMVISVNGEQYIWISELGGFDIDAVGLRKLGINLGDIE